MPGSRRTFLTGTLGLLWGSQGGRAAGPDQPLQVENEFDRLRSVLVHDPVNAIDVHGEELDAHVSRMRQEHPETRPVFRDQVIAQHRRFCELLDHHGVGLCHPEPQPGAYCQVFTRDPGFVVGSTLYLGVHRDAYRRSEAAGLLSLTQRVAEVIDLGQPGVLIEGGDVLVLGAGKLVLLGMNRHTNREGLSALAASLRASTGAEVLEIPHRALHLDCCVSPLPSGAALIAPARLLDESIEALSRVFRKLLPLDREESQVHLAANLFWLDPATVVSSLSAPRTNRLLGRLGYRVLALDFSQLNGMWGGFRCVTCPLIRGN
jgi:N-dimethylarginine dimethylaminohydrolase